MNYVLFPLLIGADGRLPVSDNPEQSIESLLEVMAYTPFSGWHGGEPFGLRDEFERLHGRVGPLLSLRRLMNDALLALKINWVSVERVDGEGLIGGLAAYSITLDYGDGRVKTHRLEL